MSVVLYMDHHVSKGITEGLRRRGVDVLTAYDDARATAEDEDLLARASQLNRVLFSQDDDLLAVADQWIQAGRSFSGLVYAHQMKGTVGELVRDLELIAKTSVLSDTTSRVQFIPLR